MSVKSGMLVARTEKTTCYHGTEETGLAWRAITFLSLLELMIGGQQLFPQGEQSIHFSEQGRLNFHFHI